MSAGVGETLVGKDIKTIIAEFEGKMREAAANLELEGQLANAMRLSGWRPKQGLVTGYAGHIKKSFTAAEIDAPSALSGRRPRR